MALGLVVGVFLGKIAREELKAGEIYFEVFSDLVLAVLFVVLIVNYEFQILIFVSLIAGYIALLYLDRLKKIKFKYFVMGIFYYIGSTCDYYLLIASLIFIYGLPLGTLEYYKQRKKRKYIGLIAWSIVIFIVTSHVLYLLG